MGKKPDFEEPVVLTPDRGGIDVGRLCDTVHRDMRKELKYVGLSTQSDSLFLSFSERRLRPETKRETRPTDGKKDHNRMN